MAGDRQGAHPGIRRLRRGERLRARPRDDHGAAAAHPPAQGRAEASAAQDGHLIPALGPAMASVSGVATGSPGQALTRRALLRLRLRAWPILQTAGAAVAAWYLAKLLVSEEQPVFASIAAVISLGATYGQRPERAIELIGGVVLGIGVADLLVGAIGSGPMQLGLLVVLAMAAAVLLGGGPLLVTEAAVSAILLASLEPASTELLSAERLIEALVGGGVAFAVSSLAFPLDPHLHVGRAAQSVFSELGRGLEELATALDTGDREQAAAALVAARGLDGPVRELEEALETGRETARSSPLRRPARTELS